MSKQDLKGRNFIGIVVNNEDPKRLGRCKVRVLDVFDTLPEEDIPWAKQWRDINGEAFAVPEKGKIVNVSFDEGNEKFPEYKNSENAQINLQEKLNSLSGSDYIGFKSVLFNAESQIYSVPSEGLVLDYKMNAINIKDSTIDILLKDKFGVLNLGSSGADQPVLLGENFLKIFSGLFKALPPILSFIAAQPTSAPGTPLIPALSSVLPAFQSLIDQIDSIKDTLLLSQHVFVPSNYQISTRNRAANGTIGDNWSSPSELWQNTYTTTQPIDFQPTEGTPPEDAGNYKAPDSQNGNESTPEQITEESLTSLSANPEIQQLIQVMKNKKYKLLERPFEPNIIGVRFKTISNNTVTNDFDDVLYVVYGDEKKNILFKKYAITTTPGFAKKSTLLPKGTSLLVEAQYLNYWTLRTHAKGKKSEHLALGQKGNPVTVRRQNATNFYDFTLPITKDAYGINIHRSGVPKGTKVFNWSEGCQVFKIESQFQEFISICENFKNRYNENNFSYTLLSIDDFPPNSILKQSRIGNIDFPPIPPTTEA